LSRARRVVGMMPPRCFVCGAEYDDVPPGATPPGHEMDYFELVYFGETIEMPPGWVGHPHNAVWFCREHVHLTQGREHVPVEDARAAINAEIGRQ
jgi:hypothetical protein